MSKSLVDGTDILNHAYTVELRFYGEGLVPSKITELLGLEPSNSSDMMSSNSRKITPFWSYNAQDEKGFKFEWESLEEGLVFLHRKLAPIKSNVAACNKLFDGIWWCGHFQKSFDGGPLLSPETLKDISSYDIPLQIDNYFSNEE